MQTCESHYIDIDEYIFEIFWYKYLIEQLVIYEKYSLKKFNELVTKQQLSAIPHIVEPVFRIQKVQKRCVGVDSFTTELCKHFFI